MEECRELQFYRQQKKSSKWLMLIELRQLSERFKVQSNQILDRVVALQAEIKSLSFTTGPLDILIKKASFFIHKKNFLLVL